MNNYEVSIAETFGKTTWRFDRLYKAIEKFEELSGTKVPEGKDQREAVTELGDIVKLIRLDTGRNV